MSHTYLPPCGHRRLYAQEHGLYESVPGEPYQGPVTMDDGTFMRGPHDEDIEAGFLAWYRSRNQGAEHSGPCLEP